MSQAIEIPVLPEETVEPSSFLDAVESTEARCLWNALNLLSHWVPASQYLDWAESDFSEGSERGWSNAVVNAKRAVCQRIDALIFESNMDQLLIQSFPDKMETLEALGIQTPEVVHELVIAPRNSQEHDYERVTSAISKNAIQIAKLFIRATDETGFRIGGRPVLFGPTFEHGSSISNGLHSFWLNAIPEGPLLFMDVFGSKTVARILNYPRREMLVTPLCEFGPTEAVRLGRWCCDAAKQKPATTGSGAALFFAMKRSMHLP